MKSVLVSIKPEWCDLIVRGKKTLEIRKTRPKQETPFKVYIYCTADTIKHIVFDEYGDRQIELVPQRVIGEFICDTIFDIGFEISEPNNLPGYPFPGTGLTDIEILQYLGNGNMGYAWHISDLKIYDKPKLLESISVVDNKAVKNCTYRERIFNNPDITNGAFLPGSYLCTDKTDWCTACKTKALTRPPQSWCYVEEV